MAPISTDTNETCGYMLAEKKTVPFLSREKKEEMNTYVHINPYHN
jgi:hypothetical protein